MLKWIRFSGRLFVSYCFVLTWAGGELLRGTLRTTASFFKSDHVMWHDMVWCGIWGTRCDMMWGPNRRDQPDVPGVYRTEETGRDGARGTEEKKQNRRGTSSMLAHNSKRLISDFSRKQSGCKQLPSHLTSHFKSSQNDSKCDTRWKMVEKCYSWSLWKSL